jgi:hypothetical protein
MQSQSPQTEEASETDSPRAGAKGLPLPPTDAADVQDRLRPPIRPNPTLPAGALARTNIRDSPLFEDYDWANAERVTK